MTFRSLSASCGLAALMAAAGLAAPAFAQDAPGTVDAVIVTAQRVAENIQDVPLSVTAIDAQKLAVLASGGNDIRFLSARVPSLTMESSFGRTFPRPYIRGLGNTDFDLNASQPVSFIYDDVVLETPVLKGFPLFDIAQVEVLRGPQGTLFGRNTPAGVLKFDSAKPTETFEGYGRASYATYGTVNLEGAVSGPIAEGLSGRLSGLYQHRDDYVDNTFLNKKDAAEGYDQYAVRGQLLYAPTDQLSVLGNVHYQKLDGTPRLFRANIIKPGTNDFVDGFDRDKIAQDAQGRAFQHVESSGASLRVNYDLSDTLKLTSISAYEHVTTLSRADVDGGFGASYAPPYGPGFIPFASESADGIPEHKQLSQELRLSGGDDKLTYQGGFFYFFEDIKIDSFDYETIFSGGAMDGYAQQHQKTKSWALFGTVDYKLTDALTVTGGLRYSDDEKDFVVNRSLKPQVGLSPLTLRANPKSDDVSWNLSTTYAVNDDLNLYARVSKGYRAPSIQGRILFGDSISVANKETVISYEAGLKTYAFDRKLRLSADAFTYEVQDLQLTAVGGGANFNRLLNADKAKGYGFEFDAEARPIEHLSLTAGLSYNHTEFDDPNLAVAPCGSGCTVLDPAGALAGTVNIDGNSLPNAPRWIANVTARYAIPYGDGEFFAFTDWAYRSKINFFLYESVEYTDDRLVEGGLRLGYAANAGWEAAVFGRNITDDLSLEGGIDFNNLTGFINEPRTWGVEVKAKF